MVTAAKRPSVTLRVPLPTGAGPSHGCSGELRQQRHRRASPRAERRQRQKPGLGEQRAALASEETQHFYLCAFTGRVVWRDPLWLPCSVIPGFSCSPSPAHRHC